MNVSDLEARFEGQVVDLASLQARGLVPRREKAVKVLGNGDLTRKLTVRAAAFSASAKEKIEKAGGVAELVAD